MCYFITGLEIATVDYGLLQNTLSLIPNKTPDADIAGALGGAIGARIAAVSSPVSTRSTWRF
jgi:hypothetical protein